MSDRPTPTDIRRALRQLSKLRLKMYGGKEPRTVEVPEVDDLDYPAWLWDETPPTLKQLGTTPDDGRVFLADVGRYYTPEGQPIPGDLTQQMNIFAAYRFRPENHIVSRPFYRAGSKIWVSTVYLGLNLNYIGDVVMTWETMVFAGSMNGVGQWRFATRNAAVAAHRDLVWRIALEQRLRRTVDRRTAPRRARHPRVRPVVPA